MSHRFEFRVSVTLDRDEGKFASRDEMSEQIAEALEGADPGSFSMDEGGTYSVSEWTAEEVQ